jgi:hypothetical protein
VIFNDFLTEKLPISSATCIASSLVGQRIIPFTSLEDLSNLSKRGIQKDAVFQVPV